MATRKTNMKTQAIAINIPECPVCMENMTAPIYQCQSGHSLCRPCTENLRPNICPICRQSMLNIRNWQLEELISKAKVSCPNKPSGCKYTMANMNVEDHLKQCIFRVMDCPLGAVFGKCFWNGKLTELMDHFKERHPANCIVNTDTDVELSDFNVTDDDRRVYLVAQDKMLFLLTMKVDTVHKMAYWVIQHLGSKKSAKEHIYEIHLTSKVDDRRKVIFIEYCFNDAITSDDIFRKWKCGILPLDALAHFIKDKNLSFKFFIKRLPQEIKKNNNDDNTNSGIISPKKEPKGPGQKYPKTKPKGSSLKQK